LKPFIKIVLAGSLLFVLAGIAQDWRNFFRLTPTAQRDDPPARAQVADTVRRFLSMARHAYRSGGDSRFVDRLPATDAVKAELTGELDYLRRNGRVQATDLSRLEVIAVELLSPTQAVVRTQEDWVAHLESAADGVQLTPPTMTVVFAEYRLARYGSGWQILDWKQVPPPPPPADGEPPRSE